MSSNLALSSVELLVKDSVVASLCRHGRKKMKQLEKDFSVAVALDRRKGILTIRGNVQSVEEAQKVVAVMSGPRIRVPAPLWAELLRTRTVDGPACLVESMQTACGCRVHIERTRHEVRIFGDETSVMKAEATLARLGPLCIEHLIPVKDSGKLSSSSLELLSQQLDVSLRLETDAVALLGMQDNVQRATAAIKEYIDNPESHPLSSTVAMKQQQKMESVLVPMKGGGGLSELDTTESMSSFTDSPDSTEDGRSQHRRRPAAHQVAQREPKQQLQSEKREQPSSSQESDGSQAS